MHTVGAMDDCYCYQPDTDRPAVPAAMGYVHAANQILRSAAAAKRRKRKVLVTSTNEANWQLDEENVSDAQAVL